MNKIITPLDADWANHHIETNIGKRQVNKIQHAFPSPRHWKDSNVPIERIKKHRLSQLDKKNRAINLYMGVPYCIKTNPGKCGYCLFPVEEYAGNSELNNYFENYIKREARMLKPSLEGQNLHSVYFGGGTSNLYKPEKYYELMDLVRELFPIIDSRVDITMEGIPQLFSRKKLEAIKGSGMNRISMGIQQFNNKLNKLSGRKQTKKQVLDAIFWSQELGLECNIDIIFGWPQQTVGTMVSDLEELIATGVKDITHYELNVGGPTDFALNRYHELPNTLTNLEMYRVSKEILLSHGYEQITTYNWRKKSDLEMNPYEEGVVREYPAMDSIGIGYAAMTFFMDSALEEGESWSFINQRNLKNYRNMIDNGEHPIEVGFQHSNEDFRLFMLFRNLFSMELDRIEYKKTFGLDLFEEFKEIWVALEDYNFVRCSDKKISIVNDGLFYTPMIQTMLAEKRYRELGQKEIDFARLNKKIPINIS